MSDPLGLSALNFGVSGIAGQIWIGIIFAFLVFIIGIFIYLVYDWLNYNVEVIIKRQVGEVREVVTTDEDGKETTRKIIPTESQNKVAKVYDKKVKKGVTQEYFKIKGTSFDYQNYFKDSDFYIRKKGLLDFKNKGIELLFTPDKGLIPLSVNNPGLMVSDISISEIIGAVTDSLKQRDEVYDNDFWNKYGQVITISLLIGFFIIGMVFIIKYQETFFENSMQQLQYTINAIKETARPSLPGG